MFQVIGGLKRFVIFLDGYQKAFSKYVISWHIELPNEFLRLEDKRKVVKNIKIIVFLKGTCIHLVDVILYSI
jgi:hypothetical protein